MITRLSAGIAVDDQYQPKSTFRKGWPAGNAGFAVPKSSRLVSSLRFGSRQSPVTLPSERPHAPSANVFVFASALAQLYQPMQPASFNQINPVRLSVIVPLLLSVNRGLGHARPLCRAPSSLSGVLAYNSSFVPSLAGVRGLQIPACSRARPPR